MMSWPASSAFSSCGMTVSSYPRPPATGDSPAEMRLIAFWRTSSLTGRDSQPLARRSPRVAGRLIRAPYPRSPTPNSGRARPRHRPPNLRSVTRPGAPPAPVDLSGAWRVHTSDGDLARRFTDPGISDAEWPEVSVPGHWRSTEPFRDSDGPMLYRRTFAGEPLAPGNRPLLPFDGIFYDGDIWLDGGYVGATAGYFFPHTFEVTQQAREVPDGGHLLAVEVASPPQRDRTKKRTITGVFSHWDNLDPDWNPGGIWRPVRLRDTGPVRIKWLRALCSEATETRGRLLLEVTLDSGPDPDPVPLGARLYATVTGPDGKTLAATSREVMLAAGD